MKNLALANYLERFRWREIGPHLIDVIIQVALYTLLFWVINRVVIFLIDRSFATYTKSKRINKKRADTMHTLIRNTTRYVIVFFAIYTILSVLGFPIGTLIASAGIVTVVVGLGAQGIIRDVIAGFLILMEQQMEVGDNVIINDKTTGRVVAFGLRITTIKDADGGLNYITNSSITTVTNLSRSNIRVQIDIPVANDESVSQTVKIIKQVNERLVPKHPEIIGHVTVQGPIILPINNQLGISCTLFIKNKDAASVKATFTTAYVNAIHQQVTDSQA